MTVSALDTSRIRRGEAGRAGNDVRSDLHVTIEERTSGGIEIALRSRVELYYGEVIRQQARNVLRALGVEHAFIEIVDEGALPFVIAARLEAAVRRAGLAEGKQALPEVVTLAAPRSEIACGARDSIFPAMSRSTSSMPDCMGPTRSFSTLKIRCTSPRRMRRACWFAMRCARWISVRRSAWYESINCLWDWPTWRKSFPSRPTSF